MVVAMVGMHQIRRIVEGMRVVEGIRRVVEGHLQEGRVGEEASRKSERPAMRGSDRALSMAS